MSRRQKMAWPRASASSSVTGSACRATGSPTSRIQFSSTHLITASAKSSLSLNWWYRAELIDLAAFVV
jgi:hypothetical protein